MVPNKNDIELFFKSLQKNICTELENLDGKVKFTEDNWERQGGGGGKTRVLENGSVFEKGGVNFSSVTGVLPQQAWKQLLTETNRKIDSDEGKKNLNFFATGISLVIHPVNPFVPIIHMNLRYFELDNNIKWFGGSLDLTPCYVNKEDAVFFHKQLYQTCNRFNPEWYQKFTDWADEYFYIKHRKESRGIGGIFFDKLMENEFVDWETIFEFVKDTGNLFIPVYSALVKRNEKKQYSEKEKTFQLVRRSRYVEFNLIYDKGTKFGLETDGRTESILISMPPYAKWAYDLSFPDGSIEAETISILKSKQDWLKYSPAAV